MTPLRLAINNGGGDAPGLNAVIRAVTLSAVHRGWEVYGVARGYEGLLDPLDRADPDPEKIRRLDAAAVRGIAHRGGTILGTINRGNPFDYPAGGSTVDRSREVLTNFERLGFDALITIGGDGSMQIARRFAALGLPLVGVPKTIDNDLSGTVFTFGFHSAVEVATEAIGRLHSTAESHDRVFVVEVMGRYVGWIALHAGIAGGADVILLPEIDFDIEAVCAKIREREAKGRRFSIVVVAEGARWGGRVLTREAAAGGGAERLGGIAARLAAAIQERTGKDTRELVLGHLQRGGQPTAFDRILAMRFGAEAVRRVAGGEFGCMVALHPPRIDAVPLEEALGQMKTVPPDCDTVRAAREMGISLGAV